MLHKMNPVRVGFIQERVVRTRQDEGQFSEERIGLGLEGMDALDVGCGGGLLSEVMLLSYEIAFLELNTYSSRVLQDLEHAHWQLTRLKRMFRLPLLMLHKIHFSAQRMPRRKDHWHIDMLRHMT